MIQNVLGPYRGTISGDEAQLLFGKKNTPLSISIDNSHSEGIPRAELVLSGPDGNLDSCIIRINTLFRALVSKLSMTATLRFVDQAFFIKEVFASGIGFKKIELISSMLFSAGSILQELKPDESIRLSAAPFGHRIRIEIRKTEMRAALYQISIQRIKIEEEGSLAPLLESPFCQLPLEKCSLPPLPNGNTKCDRIWRSGIRALSEDWGSFEFQEWITCSIEACAKKGRSFSRVVIGNEGALILRVGKISNIVRLFLLPMADQPPLASGTQKGIFVAHELWNSSIRWPDDVRDPYICLRPDGIDCVLSTRNVNNFLIESALISEMIEANPVLKDLIVPIDAVMSTGYSAEGISKEFNCNFKDYLKEKRDLLLHFQSPKGALKRLQIAHKLLKGLSEIHKAGVVHRDIKLDNILVNCDVDGEVSDVRICDFGLSRYQQTTATLHGAPLYRPPELLKEFFAEGVPMTLVMAHQDTWSMGLVLWKLFSGLPISYFRAIENLVDTYGLKQDPRVHELWKWMADDTFGEFIDHCRSFFEENPMYGDAVLGLLRLDPEERYSAEMALKSIEEAMGVLDTQ